MEDLSREEGLLLGLLARLQDIRGSRNYYFTFAKVFP